MRPAPPGPGRVNVDANIRPGVLRHASAGRLAPFYRRRARGLLRVASPRASRHHPDSTRAFVRRMPSHLARGVPLCASSCRASRRIIRAYAADNQAFLCDSAAGASGLVHDEARTPDRAALRQDGEHQYGYDFSTTRAGVARAGASHRSCRATSTAPDQFEALRVVSRAIRDGSGAAPVAVRRARSK